MKIGDKVKYIGCSEEQCRWGNNDDPALYLLVGDTVTISTIELHSWHTKLYFREIPGKYNSVCFEPVAILTLPEEKHGFCENPDSKCTMNYCDENGCIERKRNLVDADLTPSPEKKKNTMENMTEKLIQLFGKHNPEFRFDPQVSHRWIVNAFDEYTKTASGSVAAPKEEDESRNKLLSLGDKHFIIDEMTALREALKELLPIAEQYRTKIDNPNWEDDFNKSKAIIEKARKLISK